jgi:response regulator RpfG family c-di-GMP phosphodiesterase
MTDGRSYEEPMSAKEAIQELRRGAGAQFDPGLTEIFIERVASTLVG